MEISAKLVLDYNFQQRDREGGWGGKGRNRRFDEREI
jgi:hypothetical protein